ncbi:hypothetical protein BDN70DRAFT_881101 [Pholiota conissans]|uniref:DNA replication regulator SLD2 n=1 Tax=Pholiota conissans TaxID=109636 RepID=A0A9P6CRX1_9AGAR|nr:hypothetical protein BDN70DRAFT_881101 [Pholiota conissans]
MSELSTVRAEIKDWERSFKEANSRAATIDDIKSNAAIADKYKLYKRLSKGAALASSSQPTNLPVQPSTPSRSTRPKAPTSILRSKTQTVQPTAPLSTFNPFSPQKKGKGKERAPGSNKASQESRSRLFIKPSQPITNSQERSLSPVPSPLTQRIPLPSPIPSSGPHSALAGTPQNAVTRARKRLRGEPVSPSPNKDKRRRVSSQTTLPFPRVNLDNNMSDEDEPPLDADSSFVDNSPVKPPVTGRLFPSLFEKDTLPTDLFGIKANQGLMNLDSQKATNRVNKPANNAPRKNSTIQWSASTKSNGTVNATNKDIKSLAQPRRSNSPSFTLDGNGRSTPSEVSSKRSSGKRALSDEEMDEADQQFAARSRSPLIPPSPPPASNSQINRPAKSRLQSTKGAKSRKKAKVGSQPADDDDDESDELEPQGKLRIVGRNALRSKNTAHQIDEDGAMSEQDPILGCPRFATPHAASPHTAQQEDGVVEIDLPEQLRSVLALDSSAARVSEEDRLVKGLLYGRRITHYDPDKGGEIWDVGEDVRDVEHEKYTEGEDDWEGEPVPWEVGEL